MRFSGKSKYLFVARGPGETSQARALAKYVWSKGEEIVFALHQKINYPFVEKDKDKLFRIFLTENSKSLKELVSKEAPDAILLFNSKMWGSHQDFHQNHIAPGIKTVCVDSNWLFNAKKYPHYSFVRWADKYLINIPGDIFGLGLKEKGGGFIISKEMQKKIIPVGFIPFYKKVTLGVKTKIRKKYGVKKNEKLIFSYFSGFGAGHRIWAFNNMMGAVEKLVKKGRNIKVLYIGSTRNIDKEKTKRDWFLTKNHLSIDEYYETLSSSDLIFQHQGLVTLSQAISAQVPVIANVSQLSKERLQKIHFWEVGPFAKAGLCLMFSKSTPIKEIAEGIDDLCYNKEKRKRMQNLQKKHSVAGEKRAYQIIKNLINHKESN